MDHTHTIQVVELRISYRYVQEHPWVVQAMTGFLSGYFMEKPGFRVQRHFEELESGMHVWVCEIPSGMKVLRLLERLKADLPPCHYTQTDTTLPARPQYLIDCPEGGWLPSAGACPRFQSDVGAHGDAPSPQIIESDPSCSWPSSRLRAPV